MMALCGRRQQRPAAVPVELSSLSDTAAPNSSHEDLSVSSKQSSSETELLTEQPLLTLAQAYMQTRQAQKERGILAVAPALERYIGATHYRSGTPLPDELRSGIVIGSPARVYKSGLSSMLLILLATIWYGIFGGVMWGSAGNRDCHDRELPWYQRLLFVAVAPTLIAMPLLAASARAALDRDPHVLLPSAWGFINKKARLVDALYFLYCEDKCRLGRPDEVVHKVQHGRYIRTVHGDGHITLHVLPRERNNS